LSDYYRKAGLLIELDGMQAIPVVQEQVLVALRAG
jgi:hypothetical protein